MPHSPQRPAGSVGIVVERRRNPDELDGFSWYCEHCGHCLYLERVAVRNIETQLPEIFSRFYSSLARRTCSACGTVMQAPGTVTPDAAGALAEDARDPLACYRGRNSIIPATATGGDWCICAATRSGFSPNRPRNMSNRK